MRVTRVAASLLAWTVTAGAQQVSDSAGIRIVRYNRTAAPAERWELEVRPALEIGGEAEDGPTTFADIRGVVRLSDGRIAVANMRPSEIRLFDANGAFIRSLGRSGQGPGEFDALLWRLLRSRDTLFAIDNSGRAQVFNPAGQLVRSLSRSRPPNAQQNPSRVAFDPNGNAIVQALEGTAAGSETPTFLSVWREFPDTARHDRLLRVFGYQPIPRRGPAPPFQVYGARGVVAADGERICAGVSDRYAIDCYDGQGRATVFIRRTVAAKRVTDDDRQFFREAFLAANKGTRPEVIASIQESNRLTQFAQTAPAFTRVMIATSGELWVSAFDRTANSLGPPSYRRPQKPLRWSIFSPDGRWLADIETPARFMLYEAGSDYVIGATLGPDDVEHVSMYRIKR